VRHLLGQKLYLKPHHNFTIKANLISESTAKEVTQDTNTDCGSQGNTDGVLFNGSANMEVVDGKCVGQFKNLQVRIMARKWAKENKFALHFQTQIQCCSLDFDVRLLPY